MKTEIRILNVKINAVKEFAALLLDQKDYKNYDIAQREVLELCSKRDDLEITATANTYDDENYDLSIIE